MKSKLFFVFLFSILITSLVSAVPPSTTIVTSNSGLVISANIPNAIPLNSSREWEINILNETQFFNSGVTCFLHIYDEDGNGGHLYKNSSSTIVDQDIKIVVPASVHLSKGIYSYKIYCNTSIQAGLLEKAYYVTNTGADPAGDFFTVFIYLLFIVSTIILFYSLFLTIAKLVTAEETIYDVLVSWSGIILVIIVNYLSKEYLLRTFVENLTSNFLTITVWTNGVLPLFALIITIFIKSTKKRNVLTPQEIGGFRYG